MKYKQGRTFPPTAQGTGLIFAGLSLLFFFMYPDNYWILLGFYPSAWIMFSTSVIDTSRIEDGIIIKRYGFFPLKFKRKIKLENYDAAVIKFERVKYKTTQSIGIAIISEQETPDAYVALKLKLKGKYEYDLLFKGTKAEIVKFIKKYLTDTNLRFFEGALIKEMEITFD